MVGIKEIYEIACWINGYCGINNIKDIQWDSITNEIKYKIQDYWYSTMNLQPYKEETTDKTNKEAFDYNAQRCDIMNDIIKKDTEEIKVDIPKGYEFAGVDDNAQQVVFTKIGYHYPKTYEECCKVLNLTKYPPALVPNKSMFISQYEDFPHYYEIQKLAELLICRDAYWKIAGEQMGLGKPWKPDWNDDTVKYVIFSYQYLYSIDKENYRNTILAFPTEEMRAVFYENFKYLIGLCKEFL